MKWMKQAARNLVAMAAALCLLLPCAVPASAESLQTPVWMQAWGGTRTAGVVGQLEQDRFTATIRVGEMNGTVELVRDNGKMYWKAEKLDGTEVLCLLVRDGSAYQLDHSRKLAIRLGDESAAYSMIGISEEAMEKSLATGKAAGFANAKKTVNGKTYDAEVFELRGEGIEIFKRDFPLTPEEIHARTGTHAGSRQRLAFTRIGGKQASMEYRSVSDKVDESLLEIPAGYTVCTKGEDGRLRDAAGNVVGE